MQIQPDGKGGGGVGGVVNVFWVWKFDYDGIRGPAPRDGLWLRYLFLRANPRFISVDTHINGVKPSQLPCIHTTWTPEFISMRLSI